MSLTWTHRPGVALDCFVDDCLLWRYNLRRDVPKTFFHPVYTPSGRLVTCAQPWDHHWHYGIWFCWKYLNGVNVWELPEAAGHTDRGGRADIISPEYVNLSGETAVITMQFRYVADTDEVLGKETRTVTFRGVRADGSYALDWTVATSALDQPLEIACTRYAGMSYRAERAMALRHLKSHDSEGRMHPESERQQARWVDYASGVDGGPPHTAGVAIFDHPANPRHPSTWHYIGNDGFGFINPTFSFNDPYTLDPGKTLLLKYRVLVHDGEWSRPALDAEFARFAEDVKP